jgi:hypothetical protein
MQATRSQSQPSILLLQAMAEQLKLPLVQIAHQAELGHLEFPDSMLAAHIQQHAKLALTLIDGYLFGLALSEQAELPLEPVSVAAVLHKVAEQLSPLAQQYNVRLELDTHWHAAPASTNAIGLEYTLMSLGQGMIQSSATPSRPATVELRLQRSHHRQIVSVGFYSETAPVTPDILRRTRAFYGRMRQPINNLALSGAGGIFIADTITKAMAARLRPARYHHLQGLAIELLPSEQLELV